MIKKNKKTILVLKKTRSNFFASLYKKNNLYFSISFHSFTVKDQKDAYRLFFLRLFKFIEIRFFKFKFYSVNIFIFGKLIYKYLYILKNRKIKSRISKVAYLSNLAFNGCRLKKKRRK